MSLGPILSLFLATPALAQTWTPVPSRTTASLRGLNAVNPQVIWASGTNGTYLHTSDGGATWHVAAVPGAEQLDFRGIHALNDRTVYLVSSGPGEKSRIYKTIDGGNHWTLQYKNPGPQGFFDALAFWGAKHGIVLGDPVDGRFAVLTTDDGGEHWLQQPGPPASNQEGAFAASNSCLLAMGKRDAWFTTGGPSGARVFHSKDSGRTWTVVSTPIRNDSPSAGIFSLAFAGNRGIAVGGDYTKPADRAHNIAITSDGGRTWIEPSGQHPAGYRSAVTYWPREKAWIAAGTSGSDISYDNGQNWKTFDTSAYNSLGVIGDRCWAVGPNGRVAFATAPKVAPVEKRTSQE